MVDELNWIDFREGKRLGDSRSELIAHFGSRTFERLEARYQREYPTGIQRAINELGDIRSVLE